MQSRCCWPPERPSALSPRRSLTSAQSAACRSERSTSSASASLSSRPEQAGDEASVHVAVLARAVGDVVSDGLRERVGRLEHHPDALAQLDEVHVAVVQFLAVEFDRPLDAGAVDAVVHPVETAEKRRLPAARGTDERRHALLGDVDGDVPKRVVVAVVDVQVLDGEFGVALEAVLRPLSRTSSAVSPLVVDGCAC